MDFSSSQISFVIVSDYPVEVLRIIKGCAIASVGSNSANIAGGIRPTRGSGLNPRGQVERKNSMNVSKQSDEAFMAELQRTNPQRYQNLLKNMLKEQSRLAAQRKQEQAVELPKAA
jgi:hypothetical protein